MKLLIVESPAKSKTINGYLGKDFKVIASFGHIMELPSKEGSIDTENDFEMHYQISPKSTKAVTEIVEKAKLADEIYLATDPDREGEAISASIIEALKRKKVSLAKKRIFRVAFNQITKQAIIDAIKNPRELDENLINAQKARLSLDYLVGFNVSPVLWKKLPGAKSAGRVQSVALRIVCEREGEIENFTKEEFWKIEAKFETKKGEHILAVLDELDGNKLQKLDIKTEQSASLAVDKILKSQFIVFEKQTKETKRKPYAPFMTSSLQQDASTKLGFSPKKTMMLAQKLYEGVSIKGENRGLITYMRTDSPTISKDGVDQIRVFIAKTFNAKYSTKAVINYTSKAKNSQEAHEAIRPTDVSITPDNAKEFLDADELKLYTLIWKRAVASQMSEAVFESTKIEIKSKNQDIGFKANGSVLIFDGYQKVYDYSESEDVILPNVAVEDLMKFLPEDVKKEQNFTSPPPRYTEASLVKKLEELGIGRPSTYASTLAVLQEREYVKLTEKKLIPEERGRIVTAFLESFFTKYVEYDFTAKLEDELDLISSGELTRLEFLRVFWKDFIKTVEGSNKQAPNDVSKAITEKLEKHFHLNEDKQCSVCKKGVMLVKLGKYGSFIACSNYPECKNIVNNSTGTEEYVKEEARSLGFNSEHIEVLLKKGPYGHYVELNDGSKKPKRASIAKDVNIESFTLQTALELLSLPKVIGGHPEGGDIIIGLGPYGPYVAHNKKYYRIKSKEELFKLSLSEAVDIIDNSKKTNSKKEKKK